MSISYVNHIMGIHIIHGVGALRSIDNLKNTDDIENIRPCSAIKFLDYQHQKYTIIYDIQNTSNISYTTNINNYVFFSKFHFLLNK